MPLLQVSGRARAVDDPELRFSPAGTAVCSFRAVASKPKRNAADDGWEDDKIMWFRVVCFKALAENVAESVEKGTPILISGSIHNSEWETREGEKRTTTEVMANTVALDLSYHHGRITKTERSGGQPSGQSQGQSRPAEPDPWAGTDPWAAPSTEEPPF